jgi:RNA polymerase sigma-70 factor (ECF subfamily)
MSTAQDEAALLAKCRRGEPEAWDALFDEHYGPMGRFVFQLGLRFTPEDVEEICQDSLVSVVRNLESFDGKCKFQTWVFRIAANKARDLRERLNAAKRGGGQTPISLDDPDAPNVIASGLAAREPSPDTVMVERERFEMVHQALGAMGEPCREVVEMRYFGDLSYEEISSCLSLNMKTVSSRLSKCLDKLEGILSGLLMEEKTGGFPSNR